MGRTKCDHQQRHSSMLRPLVSCCCVNVLLERWLNLGIRSRFHLGCSVCVHVCVCVRACVCVCVCVCCSHLLCHVSGPPDSRATVPTGRGERGFYVLKKTKNESITQYSPKSGPAQGLIDSNQIYLTK